MRKPAPFWGYVLFALIFVLCLFILLPLQGADCIAAFLATSSVLVFVRRLSVVILGAITATLTIVAPYAILYFIVLKPYDISPFDEEYLTAYNLFWAILPSALTVLLTLAFRSYLERSAARHIQP
jgi:hypothetical protein